MTNTGNTDLYNVVVTDGLPDGTTLDEEGSDLRWKDSPNLTATIGTLASGSIEQLKLLVKVNDSTEEDGFSCSGGVDVVNIASVKGFFPAAGGDGLAERVALQRHGDREPGASRVPGLRVDHSRQAVLAGRGLPGWLDLHD